MRGCAMRRRVSQHPFSQPRCIEAHDDKSEPLLDKSSTHAMQTHINTQDGHYRHIE